MISGNSWQFERNEDGKAYERSSMFVPTFSMKIYVSPKKKQCFLNFMHVALNNLHNSVPKTRQNELKPANIHTLTTQIFQMPCKVQHVAFNFGSVNFSVYI